MRIYLAGAISNDPDYYIKFHNHEQQIKLRYPTATVVNPAKQVPYQWSYKKQLEHCLFLLSQCKKICLIDDWQTSYGATLEKQFAENNNIEIEFLKG